MDFLDLLQLFLAVEMFIFDLSKSISIVIRFAFPHISNFLQLLYLLLCLFIFLLEHLVLMGQPIELLPQILGLVSPVSDLLLQLLNLTIPFRNSFSLSLHFLFELIVTVLLTSKDLSGLFDLLDEVINYHFVGVQFSLELALS